MPQEPCAMPWWGGCCLRWRAVSRAARMRSLTLSGTCTVGGALVLGSLLLLDLTSTLPAGRRSPAIVDDPPRGGATLLSGQADPRRQEPRPTLRPKDTPRRESDRFRVRPRFSLRPYASRHPAWAPRFNTGIALPDVQLVSDRMGLARDRRGDDDRVRPEREAGQQQSFAVGG
jgi:hypothetical protein